MRADERLESRRVDERALGQDDDDATHIECAVELRVEHSDGREIQLADDVEYRRFRSYLGRQRQVVLSGHGRQCRQKHIGPPPAAVVVYGAPARQRQLMTETILLTVPAGTRGAAVVALVIGGLGSRLDLPIDRVDELTLAADILGATALHERLELSMTVESDRLLVQIGPLEDGAVGEQARRRVLEPLVDRVNVVSHVGHEYAELELSRGERG